MDTRGTATAAAAAAAGDLLATEAVAAQDEAAGLSWGDPAKLRILGKRFPRHEASDKVTGRAKYTYDIVLPGMLYGRIVRSPYASARIESPNDIDDSEAKKLDGVKAILKLVPA